MAMPPNQGEQIGNVVFRLPGLDGATLGEFPAKFETIEEHGRHRFSRLFPNKPHSA